ncbi:MAG: choice-of-anchor D domain-containing protein [Candidatus Cloacimonadaceae bacterium]|nr:choice-of-anchor D domain-containing protein [Candidatus Cloacimonadaceae bacterium]
MKKLLILIALLCISFTVFAQYLVEGFETDFVGTPGAPAGWTQTMNRPVIGTTGERDWLRNVWTGSAWQLASSGTNPTGAQSGTGVLWIDDYNFMATSTPFASRRMESPVVDLTGSTSPYIRFWYFNAQEPGIILNLRVMVSSNGGAAWHLLTPIVNGFTGTNNTWNQISIAIPAEYRTAGFRMGFEITNRYGTNNPFIDNVSVEEFTPAEIVSALTGDWNAAATWVGGVIPTTNNHVIISAGHTVTVTNAVSSTGILSRCQNLTINGILNHGAGTANLLHAFGNIVVNGTLNAFNLTSGRVVYCGGSFTVNSGATAVFNTGTTALATASTATTTGASGLIFLNNQPAFFTNNGTIAGGRINNIRHISHPRTAGSFVYNSPVTVPYTYSLGLGTINPNGILTLGNRFESGTQTVEVANGTLSGLPIWNNANVTSRLYVYYSPNWTPLTQTTLVTGNEIEDVGGVRTVTNTLTMSTHNNLQLAYPLTIGTSALGTLSLSRGILITSEANLLTFAEGNASTPGGITPSTLTPPTTHGSYVAGPVRRTYPTTGAISRVFPLGIGTAFNGATPNANVLKAVTLAAGAAASQSPTISIVSPATGTAIAPLGGVFAPIAYRVNLNGGPDFPTNATLMLSAMNYTFGNSNNMFGDQTQLRIAQATALTGPWTERTIATGTGAIVNNSVYTRTTATAAPGPIGPIATNGEYFAWGTTQTTNPVFVISPSADRDFGTIQIGTTATQIYTISNSGGSNLVISSIALQGVNTSQYTLIDANAYPLTIVPSGTATVSVRFNPVVIGGPWPIQLVATHNAAGSPSSVNITGAGVELRVNLPYTENFDGAPPLLTISPAGSWVRGTPAKTFINAAYSAPNVLVTRSLTAAYDINEDSSVTLQINTAPLLRAINVEFKHKFYTEANYDAMILEYSINNQATWIKWDPVLGTGTNWDTAASTYWYNNASTSGPVTPPKWSGTNSSTLYAGHVNGWLFTTTSIPYSIFGAAGNLALRWRFASDSSVQYDGFALDDIYVWQVPPTTIPPHPVTMVTPLNGATGVDPRTIVLDWAPAATGGAVETYDLYIGNEDDPYGSYYFPVAAPTSQFSPFADGAIVLGYNSRWYWTVQPVNTAGFPDISECATWYFNTRTQITSPATHNIGNAWPSAPKTGAIAVQNLGAVPLTFTATGSAQIVFPAGPFSIPANSTYNLSYTFNAPATMGPYTGFVTLTETSPSSSVVNVSVTATISTDVIIGSGTVNNMLPVYVYYGYTYSQTIYYPSELSWPAGYRIEKLYYYFNGNATSPNTQSFRIYMGHTSASTFATDTSWVPLSNLTMVYDANNIPQFTTGGYWMEFTLANPFIYNGVDNLVIAVDENFPGYDSSTSFFHGTNTTGNRSIRYYSDTTNPDPAAPPTGTLVAGIPNTKLFVAPIPVNPVFSITPASHNFGQLYTTSAPVTQNFTISNTGAGSLGITSISYAGAAAFTLVNVPALPLFLGTGQTAVFGVRFDPATEGTFSGTVSVTDNRNRPVHTVPISGSSLDISGGYRVANSFQTGAPSYPTYNWIDVSTTGIEITGLTDDSFTATPIPLGMTFPFFGTDMTDVFVSSNGFLSFGAGSSSLSNTAIPTTAIPNNMINFFWDDMNPASGAVTDDWIKYQTVDGNFVITFHKLPRYNGDVNGWLTAQVILFPSGKIKVQYADKGSTLLMNTFTAGIENSTGILGVQYQFDGTGFPIFGSAGEPLAVAYGQGSLSDAPVTVDPPVVTSIISIGANVQIAWNAVAGASGYKVYGSNNPYATMPWTLITTVPASQTQALVPATTAYKFYYVTAYTGTREGNPGPSRTIRN